MTQRGQALKDLEDRFEQYGRQSHLAIPRKRARNATGQRSDGD